MTREELKDKLFELGIVTDNYFSKSTFPYDKVICVGLYDREMKEDFYFFGKYDKKIYKFPKPTTLSPYSKDTSSEKYMIPLSECVVIWEDKPFIEKPDAPFGTMTLRQYACIHLKEPDSGTDWLDNLIKQSIIRHSI